MYSAGVAVLIALIAVGMCAGATVPVSGGGDGWLVAGLFLCTHAWRLSTSRFRNHIVWRDHQQLQAHGRMRTNPHERRVCSHNGMHRQYHHGENLTKTHWRKAHATSPPRRPPAPLNRTYTTAAGPTRLLTAVCPPTRPHHNINTSACVHEL